ncbi:ABC transporter substrate-binding protein [Afifella sp. IM 167]|uniref:ABC transporter substrate-binding protein n=1 Tax=Afifella sp. IM 167 TaxID=2033586 RepID=UPI001CCBFDEB|nr:ABC transporter substrate-binding protein [Afifella sp. IM 167]MBZ8132380.1 amino acid ABC transporter substrate-binding protein [Afifella sp. IM 167]
MWKKMFMAALMCSAATAAQAQEELNMGAVVTLSGPGAAWGQGMLYAEQMAAEDVNKDGGLEVGGKKYKINVTAYDDKYKANEAVTAANRIVFEDGVKYIIGTTGSAPALAIQPITEKNGVIIMMLAFTDKALSPDKPYSFRPVLTTVETATPMIKWLAQEKGVKRVGGLFVNDESGQQQHEWLSKAYEAAGIPLHATESFERDRVDMVPLITRLMAQNIDAIDLNGISPSTAGLIAKQAREMGFTGLLVRSGGPATEEIVNVAGAETVEGMLVYTQIDPSNEEVAAYAKRYQDTYGKAMNGFSPSFYDGTHMLFQAMQDAGTVTDVDKVRVALENIKDYDGILGTLNWTGKDTYGIDHQIDAPFFVSEVKDGKEVIRAKCTVDSCQ